MTAERKLHQDEPPLPLKKSLPEGVNYLEKRLQPANKESLKSKQ